MKVLNATNRTISIMLDNGELMSIQPRQFSGTVIASKAIILSAIRAGNEKELGIVVSSSYELDIARQITGAVPFVYHSDREAEAKLLGDLPEEEKLPESNLNPLQITVDKLIIERDDLKKERDGLVEDKKKLEGEVALLKTDAESSDHGRKIADLEKQLEVQSTRIQGLENDIKDKDIQIESLTDKNNKLTGEVTKLTSTNESLGKQVGELKLELEVKAEELEKAKQAQSSGGASEDEVQGYKDQINQLEGKVSGLEATIGENNTLIDELKTEGKSAVETIESMRSDFNGACKKFGLYKKDGVWFMKDPEKSDEHSTDGESVHKNPLAED